MKYIYLFVILVVTNVFCAYAQVDTTHIYNTAMPYGTLDIRLAKSESRYYYLEEGETFSFRENSQGSKTGTFADMTAWDSSPYTEGHLREKNAEDDRFVMNYRLMKPASYNASAKGYPLIVMFHGAGERGNCWKSTCYHADGSYDPNENDPPAPTNEELELLNNDHNLIHGGRLYMDAINLAGAKLYDDASLPEGAFPGFALFPQSLNGWTGGEAQDVIRIIRILVKKYNIDPDRIYVTGLSNGAHGAFEALKRAPWLFAAGIIMSAVTDGFITNVGMEEDVAHIPLWIFQGGLDTNPTPNRTKMFIRKFRDAGAVIRYSEFAEVGHTVWNSAFKEPDYFSWLLGNHSSKVHVFANSPTICDPSQGRLLSMPAGFLAYQWEYNGSIIADAVGSDYNAKAAGSYRGRFSRVAAPGASDWNEWSAAIELGTGSLPVASIRQIGTVLLRDLNNSNEAILEAEGDFAHYYWYKNGTLMDLPGSQDDTVKQITIRAGTCAEGTCQGNALYTLVTANFDNCRSTPSTGKQVYFNNQAPTNMSAPTEFTATAASPSSAVLTWKDNASTELGYEVWRRQKLSDSQTSLWEMAVLTEANANTFTDGLLLPEKTYHYKIRAVGTNGRSPYTPADTHLEITTGKDTDPPAAPANLSGQRVAIDKVLLKWNTARDNSRIKEYYLLHAGDTIVTKDTTVTVSDLAINTSYSFKVAAADISGNVGPFSSEFRMNTEISGLYYIHSPVDLTTLDSIDFSRPEYWGTIADFSLSPKVQEDFFYFRFDGYLFITDPGAYEFRLTSNDGSRMTLNGDVVVENDGVHDLATVSSTPVSLIEGSHRITVDFFDHTGEDSLLVEYRGPDTDNQWAEISAAVLKSVAVVAAEPAAAERFAVEVFPNPSPAGALNIFVRYNEPQTVNVQMVNGVGTSVFVTQIPASESLSGKTIRVDRTLPSGMYILIVSQGRTSTKRKIIIRD
jgi:hypothetical protein